MSMKIFCSDCGCKMSYSGQRPKFCSNCGVSMITNFGGAPAKQLIEAKDSSDEDLETDPQLPNISSLDVEIEVPVARGIKFGDALGSSAGGVKDNYLIDDGMPKLTEEEVLSQFKAEAGALRGGKPS